MMKKDPEEAVTLLQQSLNGASVVKSLPPDALFYLGRAQQMSGRFSEAIASYSLYTDQVGKKSMPGNREYRDIFRSVRTGRELLQLQLLNLQSAAAVEKTAISKPE